MRRYLVLSVVCHLGIALGGTLLSPMGSFEKNKKSTVVINVGLVELGDKSKSVGSAAGTPKAKPAPKALTPLPQKSTPEKVKEDQTKKPVEHKKVEPAKKNKADEKKPVDTEDSKQLAANDTIAGTKGTITEGGGENDVWGVEVGAEVNPYHRRGFAAIRANWRNPAVGPISLKCVVRFTVKRNGELTGVDLEKPSGSELFDRAAVRAVQLTKTWEEFPHFWEDDEQVIHLEFEYRQ